MPGGFGSAKGTSRSGLCLPALWSFFCFAPLSTWVKCTKSFSLLQAFFVISYNFFVIACGYAINFTDSRICYYFFKAHRDRDQKSLGKKAFWPFSFPTSRYFLSTNLNIVGLFHSNLRPQRPVCIPLPFKELSGYKTFPFIRNYLLQNLQIERIFKKSDAEVHKFCIHWPFFSRSGYKSRFRFFDKPVWK